jgi:hypothetical protein
MLLKKTSRIPLLFKKKIILKILFDPAIGFKREYRFLYTNIYYTIVIGLQTLDVCLALTAFSSQESSKCRTGWDKGP